MKEYLIYTDGSCLGNPGAGGWATVIIDTETGEQKEFFGGEGYTTNNRMELTAALVALKNTSPGDEINLVTDSSYLKNAFTAGWLAKWKKTGWKTSAGKPVKNQDLWVELDSLIKTRQVNFRWVKGHAGNDLNERCDKLARDFAAKIQSEMN